MKAIFYTYFFILASIIMISDCAAQHPQKPIWQTKEYSLFADSIVQQNKFVAKAISRNEIISNYQSPSNLFQSTKLSFKFSINGKDNEMQPGIDHHFNCIAGVNETPVIKFGKQLKDTSNTAENIFLQPDTKLTIRVDMRAVLDAFKSKGYYTTFKGDKIFKEDFKGLYVAGNTLPMVWDFDNLFQRPELELKDEDSDGIYQTTVVLNAHKDEKQTAASWTLSKDISAFPQYHSEYILPDALYNMSVEEMIKAVEPDSTFRTGKEWAGVWTRDISYSIILSMAYLQPEVAKKSLLRKVNKKKRIIQDTGTGGAYPCSTDRMIWAVAAWEIYKATGDKDWLKEAYTIIKNSIDDDEHNAYDLTTGLVRGESSFLDWREQTYPKWMQPVDIYTSENLGTNAVHYQANMVLSQMAQLLDNEQSSMKYKNNAAKIKAGINHYLWMSDKSYYAQYLYGRNFKIPSPRSEALGEALCVLFGIADQTKGGSVIANTPVTDFGISCIYPQIPNIPSYHNNAVWPFVQSYWAMAAAKMGNERSVMESISNIYRPAAMFVTNKENFVADNGDFAGTVINSSNMLWSLSGNIAMVHKVIFGIEFQPGKLLFHPFVPQSFKGERSLNNFKYRNSVLDISMEGYGNIISSFLLDGKQLMKAEIPATLQGNHSVKIILANNMLPAEKINKVRNYVTLPTPLMSYSQGNIHWQKIEGAKEYSVLRNGKAIGKTTATNFKIADVCGEYQVVAIDSKGISSFASEPFMTNQCPLASLYEVETYAPKSVLPYQGASSNSFVEISKTVNTTIIIPLTVKEPGIYAISFRYANGNGPVNTNNKCAIRTLKEGDKFLGTIVFPQRGNDEWSNWGASSIVQVPLTTGIHNITLTFDPANENMSGEINQAMLDYMVVVRVK